MSLVLSSNNPLIFNLMLSDLMFVKVGSIINIKIKGDRYELEVFVFTCFGISFNGLR
jgi:hypothetical protein